VDEFQLGYDSDELGPADVTEDLLVEIDPDGDVVRRHGLLNILDPTRLGYDSLSTNPVVGTPNDWAHANAIIPVDDGENLVVSCRHQDAVFKVERSSGDLQWILANHDGWSTKFQQYLLDAEGEDFRWPFHQHAPELTDTGSLLLFDNGSYQATPLDGRTLLPPADSSSRAVEYVVDDEHMLVRQIWEYEHDVRLFAYAVGDADLQPDSNTVLITYGALTAVGDESSKKMKRGEFQSRLVEVTHDDDKDVVFELDVHSKDVDSPGWIVYRAERIDPIR
jgi:hypothetical protein